MVPHHQWLMYLLTCVVKHEFIYLLAFRFMPVVQSFVGVPLRWLSFFFLIW